MRSIIKRLSSRKVSGVFLLILFLSLTLFTACKQKMQPLGKSANKTYYTCSMHPQIHENHPGNCPICHMELIRVETTGKSSGTGANKIMLTTSQLQIAGIKIDTVREENVGNEKTLTGTVTTNENQAEQLSARNTGRIEQLFVRTTGEKISIGQPVYRIYSEDLLEAEREYLLAGQQQKMLNNPDIDYKQLIGAAENKLLLWGLSGSQIKNLASSGKVSASVTVMSKINGTVSDIAVHEGDYVTEGMPILKTQHINALWIEAQLYVSETSGYHLNDLVSVSLPDLGGQRIAGKIDFMNPELSGASKVALIRVSIANDQGLIRPGMLAYISIANEQKRSLAVQTSAILTDGKGSRVWVKNSDNSFSPKMVMLGTGNQNYMTVVSGLNAGDVVVTSGAYLLNSEAIFKNGADKMDMGNMKM
ncbi:Cu(I)/Ag(I) efflux system membrane fusion protein [Pedobacter cryoconitis]|uniref:Cu(I)/Ag(I) efflux system membrane fusion protein n=1 Tax=Pedobacter cryoconitis TaxID=188932 RepID=A0A7W8ZJI0_9SPHI|nr:efflux RND transporter periplasmic adaptor subunit [Pedobacter cryoconitis]MBB5635030.1 Cu(I)/Ag(I) efflux system membrane fusion protein [Pedobacter cryoconitis]